MFMELHRRMEKRQDGDLLGSEEKNTEVDKNYKCTLTHANDGDLNILSNQGRVLFV